MTPDETVDLAKAHMRHMVIELARHFVKDEPVASPLDCAYSCMAQLLPIARMEAMTRHELVAFTLLKSLLYAVLEGVSADKFLEYVPPAVDSMYAHQDREGGRERAIQRLREGERGPFTRKQAE